MILDPAARHFARWLVFGSGCAFAAKFSGAKSQRISFATIVSPPDSALAGYLDQLFRAAAQNEQAVVAVFPRIRCQRDLVDLISRLEVSPRWRCTHARQDETSDVLVTLEWQTSFGNWSQTMGFAPLLTMPTTRRAPYAAIAAWPGRHRKGLSDPVGFIDMPSGLERKKHQQLLTSSREHTNALLDAEDDRVDWHTVAFRLDGATTNSR